MNIVICGLQGTGKTTLSKMLVEKYNFNYINDYRIFETGKCKNKIIEFVNNNDNYVVDLCYSLSPKDTLKLKNAIVYFLGFFTIDENVLFTLMQQKGENITLKQIIKNKKRGQKFQLECKKYNIPFYDINQDRKVILDKILFEIDKKLKEL